MVGQKKRESRPLSLTFPHFPPTKHENVLALPFSFNPLPFPPLSL